MMTATKVSPNATVQFCTSLRDIKLVSKIVGRAMREPPDLNIDKQSLEMDIEAVHCNDIPIDLPRLLAIESPHFGHDVFGIQRFIDRETGKLTQCFVPRTAQRRTV